MDFKEVVDCTFDLKEKFDIDSFSFTSVEDDSFYILVYIEDLDFVFKLNIKSDFNCTIIFEKLQKIIFSEINRQIQDEYSKLIYKKHFLLKKFNFGEIIDDKKKTRTAKGK